MRTRAALLMLLLVPSAASPLEPGVRAREQELVERIVPVMPSEGPELVRLADDGGVLHGELLVNGRAAAAAVDFVAAASRIAGEVRRHFRIPAAYVATPTLYTWVFEKGVLEEREIAEQSGRWRRVAFSVSVHGVPLEDTKLSVLFDAEGQARMVRGKIPRLSPEIEVAVRQPPLPPASAAAAIQKDVDAQAADNAFGIVPGEPVPPADLQLLAVTRPPYLLYRCEVKAALYTVDARTGAIVGREMASSEAAKRTRASVQLDALSRSIERYRIDHGAFPTTDQGLDALIPVSTARLPSLVDPWGGRFVYRAPGTVHSAGFDLCSLGADRRPGGEGSDADLCNQPIR